MKGISLSSANKNKWDKSIFQIISFIIQLEMNDILIEIIENARQGSLPITNCKHTGLQCDPFLTQGKDPVSLKSLVYKMKITCPFTIEIPVFEMIFL